MYPFTIKKFTYWNELSERMLNADSKTGFPLRDDLKDYLTNAKETFNTLASRYIDLCSQQKNIVFREQVYSYLASTLPEKHSDPHLIDYGVRKTLHRRRYGTHSSMPVRVVTEEEAGVAVAAPEMVEVSSG